MTQYTKPLPEKPSALIRLALRDLARSEANPKYSVDMGIWHRASTSGKLCTVCLAGSVMAHSLGVPLYLSLYPQVFRFGEYNYQRLIALNQFRVGDVFSALGDMGMLNEFPIGARPKVEVIKDGFVDYEVDRDAWRKCMNDIADLLEEHGL